VIATRLVERPEFDAEAVEAAISKTKANAAKSAPLRDRMTEMRVNHPPLRKMTQTNRLHEHACT
jgi:hypothetical protein